ncbi:hypothetical protein Ae201684_005169 [Aphanomyces euteiches]|uniref:Uncharacterized protein n=1 Tax=Aphanomyces euteiches TaxID=100861 RepID=A0A6G0XGC0_9STRA|nr:hypothetical protein Ae201684_005169 [Aphanomyces euteiches]KAH9155635.1 hypothetical protein AeRB84_002398 [Aphanomyces euteiches]
MNRSEQARRMAKYRREKKNALNSLQRTVAVLEYTKEKLLEEKASKHKPMDNEGLPWKEVAKALEEYRRLTESDNIILRTKLRRLDGLVQEMHRWISVQVSLMEKIDYGNGKSWRNISLSKDPEARRLGKQWIMQHMYHNTDRMFQLHGFPSLESGEDIPCDVIMNFHDDGIFSTFRSQIERETSLEQAVDYFQSTFRGLQCFVSTYSESTPLILDEVEDSTRQVAYVTPRNEYINVLCGEFITPDRCLFVLQQIQADESDSSHQKCRQRGRMTWYDIHRRANNRIQRRVLSIHTESFASDSRRFGIVEEALDYGIDLSSCPMHLRETRFPQTFRKLLETHFPRGVV